VREAASGVPFHHIVCAVDFSDCSLAGLARAATLAETCQASLTAVHVIDWPWHEPPAPAFDELPEPQAAALREYRRYATDRATAQLAAAIADVVGGKCEVRREVVHGKPHVQLLEVGREANADLIVLGVHGRSSLNVAVFGSTTNQVVRHATCPVLTVRR
jgi:nucleotide-binding universal stress UspA family protein